MSILCRNGTPHSHETVAESRACWGQPSRYARYPATVPEEVKKPVPETDQTEATLKLVKGLLDFVPDGYYAVQPDPADDKHCEFYRIDRPKPTAKSKWRGFTKIQRQIGSGYGTRLDFVATVSPAGNWHFYRWQTRKLDIENLKSLVADWRGCAMLYHEKIGTCMCCNATLTDDRSRWYGIGPECEKKTSWAWVIETVDDSDKGSFRGGH